MTALISAKVNQWTLLVGTLPVVYSFSIGEPTSLPLDTRQSHEFFLTSAQSLFAVVLLVRLWLSWRGALALLVLFGTQLFSPVYPALGSGIFDVQDRLFYALIYLALTLALLATDPGRIRQLGRLGPSVYTNLIKGGGQGAKQ
jgi:cation:H+ antiporter